MSGELTTDEYNALMNLLAVGFFTLSVLATTLFIILLVRVVRRTQK